MTSGQTIHLSDLPDDITSNSKPSAMDSAGNWQQLLQSSAEQLLLSGKLELANEIIPEVERILISAALSRTNGKKNEAAKLLGWGRNTLTRKIKDLKESR